MQGLFVDSEVEEAGFRMSSGLKQRLRNKLIVYKTLEKLAYINAR